MNREIILGLNILLGLTLLSFSSKKAVPVEAVVNVNGIRTTKGNLIIQIYRDELSYENEQPYKQLIFKKNEIESGSTTVKFSIESGVYGFTLVDDENANGRIDKNFIGVPKEGFGFSNFFMEKLKKPKFGQFQINVNKTKNIGIKVKYI
ncbi:DUF2141 domain-containing protein [Pedobacter sp. BMA]|uniref:DUF2141 domain-containing protein n=1 Tax=Pedobacter sp. BMA TaxID=1663685 RepID=UPI00064B0024|nr:DUF2141 domain-containing protein [Pedobacter sp. BMA]KLT65954.1 hypothetical protein AB669_07170 [Pedobacter sp. BMA]